jgi:hypothetical protein
MRRQIACNRLAHRDSSYQGTSSLVPPVASPRRAFAPFASRRIRPGSPCRLLPRPPNNVDRNCTRYTPICPNIVKGHRLSGNSSTGSTSKSPLYRPKNTRFKPSFQSNSNQISTLQCIVLCIPCSFINLQKPWCKILREWPSFSRLDALAHSINQTPSHFGTPPRTHYPLRRTSSYPAHRGVECILLNRDSGT